MTSTNVTVLTDRHGNYRQ